MSKTHYNVDLCIIGAGAGGLSIAAGAAQLGRSVVLYEAGEMGGDCLNHGCVPSKALIAVGKKAHTFSSGEAFGIAKSKAKVDFATVKSHIQDVIATIAPVDSQERFEGFGCIVIRERARFKDTHTVESDTTEVKAKRVIVATGSVASAPPIPGLDKTPYLTNETIFSVKNQPKHLLIIGAGPIGLELGQAFVRLGTKVEIIDIAPPLTRHEPEHAKVLIDSLKDEGILFHTPANTQEIRKSKTGVEIELEGGAILKGSHLLVAAGRRPVLDGLNLEQAGIDYDRKGIKTDDCLRSTNSKVFAVGDVSGRGGLTHAAGFHAGIIIKSFYFLPPLINRWMGKATTNRMPAVIYSEPELANIGMSEQEARNQGHALKILHWDFAENDRSIAERDTKGGVKIIATTKGRILGASIVGTGAGELIHMISMAMTNKIKISGLAQIISPYPTRSEAVKRAASSFYTEAIFGPKAKKLASFFTRFH